MTNIIDYHEGRPVFIASDINKLYRALRNYFGRAESPYHGRAESPYIVKIDGVSEIPNDAFRETDNIDVVLMENVLIGLVLDHFFGVYAYQVSPFRTQSPR